MIEKYLIAHPPSGMKEKKQIEQLFEQTSKLIDPETILDVTFAPFKESIKKGKLRQTEYVEPDKSFRIDDFFNVIMGMLEGSMGAVESNIYSF